MRSSQVSKTAEKKRNRRRLHPLEIAVARSTPRSGRNPRRLQGCNGRNREVSERRRHEMAWQISTPKNHIDVVVENFFVSVP
ncbi:hypothetical protein U1Q18_006873 [Sarracenia purpurea var. burkii]